MISSTTALDSARQIEQMLKGQLSTTMGKIHLGLMGWDKTSAQLICDNIEDVLEHLDTLKAEKEPTQ